MPRYHPYNLRPGVRQARDAVFGLGPIAYAAGNSIGMIEDGFNRWFNSPPRSAYTTDPTQGLRPQHQTKSRISGTITKYGDPGIPRKRYLRRFRLRRGRIPRKRKYRRYTW